MDIPEEEDWDAQPGVDPVLAAQSWVLALARGFGVVEPGDLAALEDQAARITEAVEVHDRLRWGKLSEEERDQLILLLEARWLEGEDGPGDD